LFSGEQMVNHAIKVLSATDTHYRIGGYGVVYGGVDLDGETFTAETDYQLDLVPRKPVYYDHAQRDIKNSLGYTAEVTEDDNGIWIEAELDRSRQYVDRVMALVHAGRVGWSSGSVAHLAQREGGVIKTWPVVEFSITPTPAEPRTLGIREIKALEDLADLIGEPPIEDAPEPAQQTPLGKGANKMSENIQAVEPVQAPPADTATADAIKALTAMVAGMKDEVQAIKAQADSRPVNDPGYAAPNVILDTAHWKYDNTDTADLAVMVGVLDAAKSNGQSKRGASALAYKALGMRLETDEAQKSEAMRTAGHAMKMSGIKANEIGQSTLASYGDEWAGVAYSGALWEKVRQMTFVIDKLPQIEFPAGAESMVIPLESTDPVWYKVAQASALTSNPGGIPTNTVTASRLGTANTTMTLSKMGARVLWTGELEEDSVLPFVARLRQQMATSAAEYLEHVLIDGDTDASASTNINAIDTTPSGSEAYLLVNGFRKIPLVTLTSNSRDGGALDVSDFLETAKLMGVGGLAAYDQSKVGFIIDRHTHWKALELEDVKTRDVFGGATLEAGRLSNIWGYPVFVSGQIAKGGDGKSNTSGKVDADTAANNTKGQILAVRWDRWQMGWRRRMTIETTRVPAADATEIVALMRFGLIYSNTDDCAAISYNLTV
jgi:phage head maturation protease